MKVFRLWRLIEASTGLRSGVVECCCIGLHFGGGTTSIENEVERIGRVERVDGLRHLRSRFRASRVEGRVDGESEDDGGGDQGERDYQ